MAAEARPARPANDHAVAMVTHSWCSTHDARRPALRQSRLWPMLGFVRPAAFAGQSARFACAAGRRQGLVGQRREPNQWLEPGRHQTPGPVRLAMAVFSGNFCMLASASCAEATITSVSERRHRPRPRRFAASAGCSGAASMVLMLGEMGLSTSCRCFQHVGGALTHGKADTHAHHEDRGSADGQHPDFGTKVHCASYGVRPINYLGRPMSGIGILSWKLKAGSENPVSARQTRACPCAFLESGMQSTNQAARNPLGRSASDSLGGHPLFSKGCPSDCFTTFSR